MEGTKDELDSRRGNDTIPRPVRSFKWKVTGHK